MKIGLEIHQRLDTEKLFCRCSSQGKRQPCGTLYRKLHTVKSELGEKDIAAQKEELKEKVFEYVVYDNSCLVECDEEPPHNINLDALSIAVSVAKHLHMNIVDQVFVMRKIVIDGSNTSGFQRTAVVGLDGWVDTRKGNISIQTLCIEEESAGIIEGKGSARFGLDRLGIPLIEIATGPDIVDGEHAREVAEQLGTMLRLTGKAARGIGTIRQDINISIDGGARVEIKGVQELDDIPIIIENEVMRQRRLIEINKMINPSLKPGKVNMIDVTNAFTGGTGWIQKSIGGGARAMCIVLPGLKGLLGAELYSGRRFGTELSDYARSFGFGGMIHGDEDFAKYKVDKGTVEAIIGLKSNDSYAILIGNDTEKMRIAFEHIINRAYLCKVPSETRRALSDGATEYMRPMATGARMYPETDVEPIMITKEFIDSCVNKYPVRNVSEVISELERQTNKDIASQLIKSRFLSSYYNAVNKGIDPKLAGVVFTNVLKSISRDGLDIDVLNDDLIIAVLEKHRDGAITKKAVEEVLRHMCKSPSASIDAIIDDNNLRRISGDALKKLISEIGDERKILEMYRLNVDAEELMRLMRKK
ncbi:MAG: Glu-tRNA(Gln) amidotransferase subunit GatE [Candidatus Micrarchaeia archaeon]